MASTGGGGGGGSGSPWCTKCRTHGHDASHCRSHASTVAIALALGSESGRHRMRMLLIWFRMLLEEHLLSTGRATEAELKMESGLSFCIHKSKGRRLECMKSLQKIGDCGGHEHLFRWWLENTSKYYSLQAAVSSAKELGMDILNDARYQETRAIFSDTLVNVANLPPLSPAEAVAAAVRFAEEVDTLQVGIGAAQADAERSRQELAVLRGGIDARDARIVELLAEIATLRSAGMPAPAEGAAEQGELDDLRDDEAFSAALVAEGLVMRGDVAALERELGIFRRERAARRAGVFDEDEEAAEAGAAAHAGSAGARGLRANFYTNASSRSTSGAGAGAI